MADDAGALLVRSGLVSSNALDDARARVASVGGTLGEQLVTSGAIGDDELTEFYRTRLLVPQVNPNTLARLTPKVVAAIPSDMAIELRTIPVSLDADNNLTVAMSDPSDRHAVDEIAFFTGAYVVRAVATQMQIAWCLAHYYGHVTALGQRLLRASQSPPPAAAASRLPRTKGLTGKVNATRHRAIAPVTGPVDVLRPSSGPLDLGQLDRAASGSTSAAGNGQRSAVQPPAESGPAGAVTAAAATAAARPAAAAVEARSTAAATVARPAAARSAGPIADPPTVKLAGPTSPGPAPASGASAARVANPASAAAVPAGKPAVPGTGAPRAAAAARLAGPASAADSASTPAAAPPGAPTLPGVAARPASAAAATSPGGVITAKLATPTSAAEAATSGGAITAKFPTPASAAEAATSGGAITAKFPTPASAAEAAASANAGGAGDASRRTGVTPPPGIAPRRTGVTPPPGIAPRRTGVTPPPGIAPRRTDVTPPPGIASRRTGVTPPPATAPRRTGVTPPPATAPRPAGSTPPPAGRSPAASTASAPAAATPSPRPAASAGAPAGVITEKLGVPTSTVEAAMSSRDAVPAAATRRTGVTPPPGTTARASAGSAATGAAASGGAVTARLATPASATGGTAPSAAITEKLAVPASAAEAAMASSAAAAADASTRRTSATPPSGAARAASPAPAPAARASAATAGPSAPTMIPGVFSPVDDALPQPMLDDSHAAPVLDDALPTVVLDEPSAPMTSADLLGGDDDVPERPRTRSISGEIRVPVRRAPSIKPPLAGEDDDDPLIMIERGRDDASGPRAMPPRRRAVKSDPPELYARAGEVDLKSSDDHAIDIDEPRIVVDEDALSPPSSRIDARATQPEDIAPSPTAIDVIDDVDTGAVIHDRPPEPDSQPILLDRVRPSDRLPAVDNDDAAEPGELDHEDDVDTGEIDIVVLESRKKPRPERRTRIGVPPAPVNAHAAHDTEARRDLDRAAEVIGDETTVDLHAAPPGEDTTSDQIAAPPAPASDLDTNPYIVASPPAPAPPAPAGPRAAAIRAAVIVEDDEYDEYDDDDDDDGEPPGPRTAEMTAVQLDDAIPERNTELPEALLRHRVEYDPVDDGWGPPGTTIPPPLLGAIPGSEDDDELVHAIPMPNVDSSPLLVGPASSAEPAGRALVRALEEATARAIDVIRELEGKHSRDEIIELMISHLHETHHRAGFFVTRHAVAKGAGELALFAMTPQPAAMPSASLRLDRPSTLQDVVGTRLPYRGPMHDDASRAFLISVLGTCPAEILLVPVAVRERVVGVLFGEHRLRHTFDDQLALAARAAGMALERILRAKRG